MTSSFTGCGLILFIKLLLCVVSVRGFAGFPSTDACGGSTCELDLQSESDTSSAVQLQHNAAKGQRPSSSINPILRKYSALTRALKSGSASKTASKARSHDDHFQGQLLQANGQSTEAKGLAPLGFRSGTPRIWARAGTPAQGPMNAILDLGSSDVWFTSPSCKTSDMPETVGGTGCPPYRKAIKTASGTCPSSGTYDPSVSSTSSSYCSSCLCEAYSAGWASGGDYSDKLWLGDGPGLDVWMGSITLQQDTTQALDADGIIGLGFTLVAFVTIPTLTTEMQTKGISYFTLCIPQCEAGNPGGGTCESSELGGSYSGFICLGCEAACDVLDGQTDLPWVQSDHVMNVTSTGYAWWLLSLSSLTVNGNSGPSELCSAGCFESGAILDSGFALIALPGACAENFMATLQRETGPSCSVSNGQPVQGVPTLVLECSSLPVTSWPNLNMTLGGVHLTLAPKYYVQVNGTGTRGIFQVAQGITELVLGAAFLNAFYTKYNPSEYWVAFKGVGVNGR
ncbi:unnamed protein product [Polarella glacialis]|nr:unnamed protein product [Polarella glacialis]|mmetsp:Transcript_93457/g.168835  ORF Transcript_93457/g.168835 Transcript_93457/m.168835 type:complete len:511 (+) Transcript_93457:112-1644(+)|eukprot:CAMPEP_0115114670 /NCGR_PEP_ID=MMETSP0227-20121206/42203_1 /TAXON_ID=89957 /ORGANISM="Polarella glacialis, Strain CCMP 1383" /LENGTH=510 /DNA_ID=CAMNT_0002515131 /DNA_START=74 /DNA_END=1606 /DNA_ORIENTATION=+